MKNYPDFTGVTRIRLLVFLRRHRFFHTAHALEKDTTVFFDLQHVVRLVRKDRWEEAARYVSAFVPVENASKEVSSLRRGMFMNFVVQNIAFGGEQGDPFASMYAPHNSDATKFAQQQRDRSSSEWEQMRHKTIAFLNSLLPRTPELKDKMRFPRRMTRLSGLVRVGLPEFRRKRFYKEGRVSKLNAALLRKRLRSIQERSQSPMLKNTGHHGSLMRIGLTRLLCYLKQSGFYDTAHALERDTGLFFDRWYMDEMVARFQWNEAAKYMLAFVSDRDSSKEASNLLNSIQCLKKSLKASKVFEKSRASCWRELGHTTITALSDLVPRTPELKDKLQLPYYKARLSDTTPLACAHIRGIAEGE